MRSGLAAAAAGLIWAADGQPWAETFHALLLPSAGAEHAGEAWLRVAADGSSQVSVTHSAPVAGCAAGGCASIKCVTPSATCTASFAFAGPLQPHMRNDWQIAGPFAVADLRKGAYLVEVDAKAGAGAVLSGVLLPLGSADPQSPPPPSRYAAAAEGLTVTAEHWPGVQQSGGGAPNIVTGNVTNGTALPPPAGHAAALRLECALPPGANGSVPLLLVNDNDTTTRTWAVVLVAGDSSPAAALIWLPGELSAVLAAGDLWVALGNTTLPLLPVRAAAAEAVGLWAELQPQQVPSLGAGEAALLPFTITAHLRLDETAQQGLRLWLQWLQLPFGSNVTAFELRGGLPGEALNSSAWATFPAAGGGGRWVRWDGPLNATAPAAGNTTPPADAFSATAGWARQRIRAGGAYLAGLDAAGRELLRGQLLPCGAGPTELAAADLHPAAALPQQPDRPANASEAAELLAGLLRVRSCVLQGSPWGVADGWARAPDRGRRTECPAGGCADLWPAGGGGPMARIGAGTAARIGGAPRWGLLLSARRMVANLPADSDGAAGWTGGDFATNDFARGWLSELRPQPGAAAAYRGWTVFLPTPGGEGLVWNLSHSVPGLDTAHRMCARRDGCLVLEHAAARTPVAELLPGLHAGPAASAPVGGAVAASGRDEPFSGAAAARALLLLGSASLRLYSAAAPGGALQGVLYPDEPGVALDGLLLGAYADAAKGGSGAAADQLGVVRVSLLPPTLQLYYDYAHTLAGAPCGKAAAAAAPERGCVTLQSPAWPGALIAPLGGTLPATPPAASCQGFAAAAAQPPAASCGSGATEGLGADAAQIILSGEAYAEVATDSAGSLRSQLLPPLPSGAWAARFDLFPAAAPAGAASPAWGSAALRADLWNLSLSLEAPTTGAAAPSAAVLRREDGAAEHNFTAPALAAAGAGGATPWAPRLSPVGLRHMRAGWLTLELEVPGNGTLVGRVLPDEPPELYTAELGEGAAVELEYRPSSGFAELRAVVPPRSCPPAPPPCTLELGPSLGGGFPAGGPAVIGDIAGAAHWVVSRPLFLPSQELLAARQSPAPLSAAGLLELRLGLAQAAVPRAALAAPLLLGGAPPGEAAGVSGVFACAGGSMDVWQLSPPIDASFRGTATVRVNASTLTLSSTVEHNVPQAGSGLCAECGAYLRLARIGENGEPAAHALNQTVPPLVQPPTLRALWAHWAYVDVRPLHAFPTGALRCQLAPVVSAPTLLYPDDLASAAAAAGAGGAMAAASFVLWEGAVLLFRLSHAAPAGAAAGGALTLERPAAGAPYKLLEKDGVARPAEELSFADWGRVLRLRSAWDAWVLRLGGMRLLLSLPGGDWSGQVRSASAADAFDVVWGGGCGGEGFELSPPLSPPVAGTLRGALTVAPAQGGTLRLELRTYPIFAAAGAAQVRVSCSGTGQLLLADAAAAAPTAEVTARQRACLRAGRGRLAALLLGGEPAACAAVLPGVEFAPAVYADGLLSGAQLDPAVLPPAVVGAVRCELRYAASEEACVLLAWEAALEWGAPEAADPDCGLVDADGITPLGCLHLYGPDGPTNARTASAASLAGTAGLGNASSPAPQALRGVRALSCATGLRLLRGEARIALHTRQNPAGAAAGRLLRVSPSAQLGVGDAAPFAGCGFEAPAAPEPLRLAVDAATRRARWLGTAAGLGWWRGDGRPAAPLPGPTAGEPFTLDAPLPSVVVAGLAAGAVAFVAAPAAGEPPRALRPSAVVPPETFYAECFRQGPARATFAGGVRQPSASSSPACLAALAYDPASALLWYDVAVRPSQMVGSQCPAAGCAALAVRLGNASAELPLGSGGAAAGALQHQYRGAAGPLPLAWLAALRSGAASVVVRAAGTTASAGALSAQPPPLDAPEAAPAAEGANASQPQPAGAAARPLLPLVLGASELWLAGALSGGGAARMRVGLNGTEGCELAARCPPAADCTQPKIALAPRGWQAAPVPAKVLAEKPQLWLLRALRAGWARVAAGVVGGAKGVLLPSPLPPVGAWYAQGAADGAALVAQFALLPTTPLPAAGGFSLVALAASNTSGAGDVQLNISVPPLAGEPAAAEGAFVSVSTAAPAERQVTAGAAAAMRGAPAVSAAAAGGEQQPFPAAPGPWPVGGEPVCSAWFAAGRLRNAQGAADAPAAAGCPPEAAGADCTAVPGCADPSAKLAPPLAGSGGCRPAAADVAAVINGSSAALRWAVRHSYPPIAARAPTLTCNDSCFSTRVAPVGTLGPDGAWEQTGGLSKDPLPFADPRKSGALGELEWESHARWALAHGQLYVEGSIAASGGGPAATVRGALLPTTEAGAGAAQQYSQRAWPERGVGLWPPNAQLWPDACGSVVLSGEYAYEDFKGQVSAYFLPGTADYTGGQGVGVLRFQLTHPLTAGERCAAAPRGTCFGLVADGRIVAHLDYGSLGVPPSPFSGEVQVPSAPALLQLLAGNATVELFDPPSGAVLRDPATGEPAAAKLLPGQTLACDPPGSPKCMGLSNTATETWPGWNLQDDSEGVPWWVILLIVLLLLCLIALLVCAVLRRRRQQRADAARGGPSELTADLGSPAAGKDTEPLELPLLDEGTQQQPPETPPDPPALAPAPAPKPQPLLPSPAAAPAGAPPSPVHSGMGIAPPSARRPAPHLSPHGPPLAPAPSGRPAGPALGPGGRGPLDPPAARLHDGARQNTAHALYPLYPQQPPPQQPPPQQMPPQQPPPQPTPPDWELGVLRGDLIARQERLRSRQAENAQLQSELLAHRRSPAQQGSLL
eukprot:TRINITY_DN2166_c2_g1_i2.p1 TRINITY_DN2166_c2_g1~~TRINITY_DN2166_c2_g1_i2.p1  ORF type:complete len:2770 (+),score=787.75 TRINITY_DN2166_c2_g1_i2:91-8400(+)